jgi:hypothetical protein
MVLSYKTEQRRVRSAKMAIFYTHFRKDTLFAPDEEGEEFVDLNAARRQAASAARTIIADEIADGRDQIGIELHIHDEAGVRLAVLPFTAAVSGFD